MKVGLDLDGTIISCREKHSILMLSIANAFNIKIDINKYWQCKRQGNNNKNSLMELGIEKDTVKLLDKQWCQSIENIEWLAFDKILPDCHAALEKFKNLGHTLHLISARNSPVTAKQQLHHLNLMNYFDSVDFVQTMNGEGKELFFKQREIDVYIGDTEYDKKCADLVGIECRLVSTGMRNKTLLLNFSDEVYETLSSIF